MTPSISPTAARQVLEIYRYIARDDEAAAERVRARIFEVIDFVAHYPRAGHATKIPELRQMPANPYPYIVYFRWLAKQKRVRITRVLHSAQSRPALRDPDQVFRFAMS